MNHIIREAENRIRNRGWDDNIKGRRAVEYRETLDRLDEAEYQASFPDNENRVRDLEQIRRTRAEVTKMMDEEFGMSEQYRQIADS